MPFTQPPLLSFTLDLTLYFMQTKQDLKYRGGLFLGHSIEFGVWSVGMYYSKNYKHQQGPD